MRCAQTLLYIQYRLQKQWIKPKVINFLISIVTGECCQLRSRRSIKFLTSKIYFKYWHRSHVTVGKTETFVTDISRSTSKPAGSSSEAGHSTASRWVDNVYWILGRGGSLEVWLHNGTLQNGNATSGTSYKTVRVTKRYVLQNDTCYKTVCVTKGVCYKMVTYKTVCVINWYVTKRYMLQNGTFFILY